MTAEPRRSRRTTPAVLLLAGGLGLVLAGLWLRGGARERARLGSSEETRPETAPQTVLAGPEEGRSAVPAAAPLERREVAATGEKTPVPARPRATKVGTEKVEYWGRALDLETGAPLAGVRVRPRVALGADLALDPSGVEPAATSDADGRFRLRWPAVLHPGPHALQLEGYGLALLLPDDEHRDPTAPQVLELRRAATLVAQVVGAWEGQLALQARSYALGVPDDVFVPGSEVRWNAPLDASGRTELTLPARVPMVVQYQPPQGAAQRLDEALVLEPGERRLVEWRVGAGAVLVGRVVDQDGTPVIRAEVGVTRRLLAGDPLRGSAFFHGGDARELFQSTRTDKLGGFRFEDLEPGRWWVGLTESRARRVDAAPDPGDRPAPLFTVVEIAPGAALVEVTLATWRGLAIRGLVLDPDGAPAADERITGRPTDPDLGGFREARSAEDGTFVLGPLVPGQYALRAGSFGDHAPSEVVSAAAGAEDVELRLRAPGAIRGRVVEAATGQGRTATLWFSERAGGAMGATADEDGAFLRSGLAPGTYDLAASTPDGLAGVVAGIEVATGQEVGPLRVALAPGARVAVRYVGPATYASFTVFHGTVPAAMDGIHTGTTATHTVPAGALRVRLQTRDGFEEVREVMVAPGERVEVAFELE